MFPQFSQNENIFVKIGGKLLYFSHDFLTIFVSVCIYLDLTKEGCIKNTQVTNRTNILSLRGIP